MGSVKAESNYRKHRISFEQAAEVFSDPLALTIPDPEHSDTEPRWITMGKDRHGQYCLVVHTYSEIGQFAARVRLISARTPTKSEIAFYEDPQ